MALSEREERMFEELKQSLFEDEEKTSFMSEKKKPFKQVRGVRLRKPVSAHTKIVTGILLLIAGIAIMVTGVATNSIFVGLLGFAVMFAGGYRAAEGRWPQTRS